MDASERNRLVLAHLGLAHAMAWQLYRGRPVVRRLGELADVDQQAMLGLIAAVEHFDPARGAKFSTFAVAVIRNEILTAAHEHSLVAVPEGTASVYRRPQETEKRRRNAGRVRAALRGCAALPPGFDRPAPGAPDAAGLDAALRGLPAADRALLERRFGLAGPCRRVSEVAAEDGLKPRTVSARQRRALDRLRGLLGVA